jgi:AAA domain
MNRRPAHPWPNVAGANRNAAVKKIALDLRLRGYSGPHAAIVLAHWNNRNRPPATGYEIAEIVDAVYRDATRPQTEPTFEGLLAGLKEGVEPRGWLVPGFLPARERVALLGRWSHGKSLLGLEAARCLATGSDFLGVQTPDPGGNVVMLDGEGGRRRARRRLGALCRGAGLDDAPKYEIFWRRVQGLHLTDTAAMTSLRRDLEPLNPSLIIFDTRPRSWASPTRTQTPPPSESRAHSAH